MIKLNRIIIAFLIATFIPSCLNAQRRFEISAGISTPGYHVWEKGFFVGERIGFVDKYADRSLADMDLDAYKSSYHPGYSIQGAYKLPDHGFTKRLSLVGYVGLNVVGFEKMDYLTNTSLYNETAYRFDVLFGIRYHIITKEKYMMYTQAMIGGHIDDHSRYWECNSFFRKNDPVTAQITFLGFRFKTAQDDGFCFMTELGTGSEYGLSGLIIIPGVRLGLGYTF